MKIEGIPALLWGRPGKRCIVAVHGSQSSKEDAAIAMVARYGEPKGAQVLSFDLPGHGERRDQPCKFAECAADFKQVTDYARGIWGEIDLFGISLGAYLGLTATADAGWKRAWLLSPVVDMEGLVESMLRQNRIDAAQLEQRRIVEAADGQPIYWEDYCYVREHPIEQWPVTTSILCGGKDALCPRDTIESFAARFGCQLEVAPDAPHYFHTEEHMTLLGKWLEENL